MPESEKPPTAEPPGAGPFRAAPASSLISAAGGWLALLGTVIATGQAGTAWLHGYWQAEAEKQRSAHELALADLKDKADLAQQYLKIILDKDTKAEDRAVLLTALAAIDGHPLQKWAQDQYADYLKNRDKLFEAYRAQAAAAQSSESAHKQSDLLSADITVLTEKLEIARDAPDEREKLQNQLIQESQELAHVKATLSIAELKVEETKNAFDRSQQGLPAASGATVADTVASISSKITVSLLKSVFPDSAAKNIDVSTPYLQAALQEFKVSDKRLVASIVATVAVETPSFEAYEEPVERGQAYEGRLGNTSPGDGVKYRGRGYLGLTGRANYQSMSARLGLGNRLLDFPEDAKSPEVACRILVAWFVDRQNQLSPALANGDLGAARRVVAGGTTQLERFTTVYQKILAAL